MNIVFPPFKSMLAWVCLMVIVTSCNKTFDAPPINTDPDIAVTLTIKDLKARYTAINNFQTIAEDKVIAGIVTADDRSGNFYKQIVIQDETGGIPILLDGNSLYASYPIGRKVFVKVKGLMLGDYAGTIQLGLDSSRSDDGRYLNVGRIPTAQFDQFIVKGSFGNVVTPKIVKPSEFTKNIADPLLSTLVQINNSEFKDNDLNKAYGDSTLAQTALNFTMKTCDNQSYVLRNSSYAKFARLKVAQGNGSLVGVAGIFNSTIQISIRDTADVQLKGSRCSGQAVTKTIAEVLRYATGDSTIASGVWIEAIVISDTKNETAGNYRLQDATAGIQLRFANGSYPASAAVGDKLKVNVGGFKLSTYNGGLQINGVETATAIGTGSITPRATTIADIAANLRAWESTLVTVSNVTVTGSGTNYMIKDASGELASFVRAASGITMPNTATSITGYVSVYQAAGGGSLTPQLILRTPADIVGGTSQPPTGLGAFTATYDFAAVTNTSGTTDPTPPPSVAKLTFSNCKAVGLSANSSGGGRFSFSGWPLGATHGSDVFTGSIDLTKYYEITITPESGTRLDLAKLIFTLQRSSTGVRQAVVRSSIDGYAANLPATIDPANANLSIAPTYIFQVTDASSLAENGSTITFTPAHTNLNAAVTLRFYGLNAESAGGTFSVDNVVITGATK